jgi:hypothetical protein
VFSRLHGLLTADWRGVRRGSECMSGADNCLDHWDFGGPRVLEVTLSWQQSGAATAAQVSNTPLSLVGPSNVLSNKRASAG